MAKETSRSGYSKIRIANNEILVDDKKISGVRSINLFLSSESIPIADVELELDSTAEFDGIAETKLTFTPDTLVDAIRCIKFSYKIDDEFRRAFIASAKSALDDMDLNTASNAEIAKEIVERILDEGEEYNDSY